MKKLKILWNNRNTWRRAFDAWYALMFPHLYYSKCPYEDNLIDIADDVWWFCEALNNYDHIFDDEDR
jgi:hypothetical protein